MPIAQIKAGRVFYGAAIKGNVTTIAERARLWRTSQDRGLTFDNCQTRGAFAQYLRNRFEQGTRVGVLWIRK
jgi:hypothetical protein